MQKLMSHLDLIAAGKARCELGCSGSPGLPGCEFRLQLPGAAGRQELCAHHKMSHSLPKVSLLTDGHRDGDVFSTQASPARSIGRRVLYHGSEKRCGGRRAGFGSCLLPTGSVFGVVKPNTSSALGLSVRVLSTLGPCKFRGA